MKFFTNILMVLVLTGFMSCGDSALNEEIEEVETIEIPSYKNMIAATIVTDISGNNLYDHQLLLIDYNNPENYEIVLKGSISPMFPTFSPDGSKLFFLDSPKYPSNVESGFGTLDLNSGVAVSPYPKNNFFMSHDVEFCWKPDGKGLFISSPEWETLLDYDLNEREGFYVQDYNFISPFASYSTDGVIGYRNVVDGVSGFYVLDNNLNVVEKLDNPWFTNEIHSYNWAWHLSYNNENGLFAYSNWDHNVVGIRVAITDKEGTSRQKITSGEHIDIKPVWGPNGDTILFLRRTIEFQDGHSSSSVNYSYRLMKVTISTGVVEEIFNYENVEGAIGFSGMDFTAY